ncbi:glycosyltransferase family 2 protein [Paracraurococcus lichenis]|uniref:Glycosyltransferase n=1 Tax=Paracraurococcus lichenis TaxID=3064888 RepID=A0ABT9DWM6_9PROT|nr:glycosyltransferase [Paracraurococcus sp. LOR1-02]MDO9708298.1 glycosyltransferase [Paracraurococcus sp. LOR1-02]
MSAAQSAILSASAEGHRGRIEAVEIGTRFLLVSGWVAGPQGGAPGVAIALDLPDGSTRPITRFLRRKDLAQRGIATEPCGFLLDLPRPEGDAEAIALTLRAGEAPLLSQRIAELAPRHFRPRGHLDHVSPERLAGWVFDPAQWHGPEEEALLELVVDGTERITLPLNATRPDLPFSGAAAGRRLGFELGLQEVARLVHAAGLERTLLEGEHEYALLAGGQRIGLLQGSSARRGRIIPRGTRPAEAPAPAPVQTAPGKPEPDGFVDWHGYSKALGGWFFGGWVRGETLKGVETCRAVARFEDAAIEVEAPVSGYPRPDVESIGIGYIAFVPSASGDPGLLQGLELSLEAERKISPSLGTGRMKEAELLALVRTLLGAETRKPRTPLLKVLAQPSYQGEDTLAKLPVPVHLEVDAVLAAPGAGLVLQGWCLDPNRAIAAIRLRARGFLSAPLAERWIATDRPDIRDAFADRYTLDHARHGYLAYVEASTLESGEMHLEIELESGETGFKPLPAPGGGGAAAIRKLLGGIQLAPDEVVDRCDRVLGPPVVALNRQRLATAGRPSVVEVGTLPERPRCSIIIPLYGRIDYLMYQCALLSEHGLAADELVYVLDDPPKKQALMDLAQSAYRRFGIPMKLVLLPENRGYAPANNAGLAECRGEYICYLNSDVMPQEPRWLDLLIGALEEDATLGITGGFLTFEDGTIQHAGMTFKRLPQLGNFPYAMHPGKGRKRAPSRGLKRAEAVTGACMVLRRDLAAELGGFDTDYVIGDFEDADLCLRIRAKGLDCAVHEDAVLWHLERQSQGTPGNFWRHNLTLINGWTFARRWGHCFPAASADTTVLRLA